MNIKSRAVAKSRLETVINSVFDYHLQEAIWRLTEGDTNRLNKEKGDSVRDVFRKLAGSEQKKIKTLYEVELDLPYKHCFISFFKNENFEISNLQTKQRLFESDKKIRKIYLRHTDKRYLKKSVIQFVFDHEWKFTSWKDIPSSGGKKLREEFSEVRRHPIFLRLNIDSGRLAISYQGFQGGGEKYASGGIVYSELISSILKIAEINFGIELININLKNTIKELSSANSKKFTVKMIDSSYKELKLLMKNSSTQGKSILEELSEGLSQYLKIPFDRTYLAFENLIKNSLVDEASLYWNSKKIRTNLRFLHNGPEVTFSWDSKGSNRSLSDQSEIIDTLFLLSGHAAYDNEREAWDYLIALKANSVIRANEIMQKTGCSAEIIKRTIMAALESGIVAPRYRLKTSIEIQDYENIWKERPQDFEKTYIDSHSNEIDARDISNLEIGFARLEVKEQ